MADESDAFNSYTAVTHQSYGSRLQDSCKAMCMGPFLILAGIALLIWNEGDAVATHRALEEGAKATISLPSPNVVEPQYEGRLVHLTGRAVTEDAIRDDLFGTPPGNFLKLKRQVEMYQWTEDEHKETKKDTGGGTTTTTTYTYRREWKDHVVNSNNFYDSTHHQNPSSMPFDSITVTANPITLGAHTLSDQVLNHMNWFTDHHFSDLSTDNIPDNHLRQQAQVRGNDGFYIGSSSPSRPAIGDTRVSFQVVEPQTMSLVAEQIGDTFTNYMTKNNKPVLLVEPGVLSVAEMYARAHAQRTLLAFVLRLVGFVVIFVGMRSLAEPLATFADVIPCLGTLVGEAASCILCPFAFALALLVICIAWIAYRPWIAIPAVVAILAGVAWYVHRQNRVVTAYSVVPEAEESVTVPVPPYHYKQTEPEIPVATAPPAQSTIPVATVMSVVPEDDYTGSALPPPLNPGYQSTDDVEKGQQQY